MYDKELFKMYADELLLRLREPSCIPSFAKNMILDIWNSLAQDEFSQLYRLIRPYTVVSNSRLRALYNAVKYVVKHNIPGNIVECGAARGGSAALMGLTLKQVGAAGTLWVFDNFAGLPEPSESNPDWAIAKRYAGKYRGEVEEVRSLYSKLGILSNCKIVKGAFQQTVAVYDGGEIAVLHLDGDWYESTKVCLEHLYKWVSRGGVIQIDDYGYFAGARKAVEEFLEWNEIRAELKFIDYAGRQMIKPYGD